MVKTTVRRAYVIENPTDEEIVGTFYEKELPKPNKTKFRTKKIIKKVINYIWSGKVIHLIDGQTKRILIYEMSYFLEPYSHRKKKSQTESVIRLTSQQYLI